MLNNGLKGSGVKTVYAVNYNTKPARNVYFPIPYWKGLYIMTRKIYCDGMKSTTSFYEENKRHGPIDKALQAKEKAHRAEKAANTAEEEQWKLKQMHDAFAKALDKEDEAGVTPLSKKLKEALKATDVAGTLAPEALSEQKEVFKEIIKKERDKLTHLKEESPISSRISNEIELVERSQRDAVLAIGRLDIDSKGAAITIIAAADNTIDLLSRNVNRYIRLADASESVPSAPAYIEYNAFKKAANDPELEKSTEVLVGKLASAHVLKEKAVAFLTAPTTQNKLALMNAHYFFEHNAKDTAADIRKFLSGTPDPITKKVENAIGWELNEATYLLHIGIAQQRLNKLG